MTHSYTRASAEQMAAANSATAAAETAAKDLQNRVTELESALAATAKPAVTEGRCICAYIHVYRCTRVSVIGVYMCARWLRINDSHIAHLDAFFR